nr:DNA adenine methylase [Saccharicrinis carchari]
MKNVIYAEPYAGGAGAGINLLLEGVVKRIYINDASKPIFAFWYSLIECSEAFMELFENVEITLEEWFRCKNIFQNSDSISTDNKNDMLALGFATFFMNRCNRSGVLNAGPIGGNSLEAQLQANYKIDARFKKDFLREKLYNIIANKKNIKIFNDDALYFLKYRIKAPIPTERQKDVLIYLDPPYYVQGSSLYMNYYKHDDHFKLSKYLKRESFFKWILSYDDVEEVSEMYRSYNQYTFALSYTVQQKKKGSELLIHSRNSIIPHLIQSKKSKRKEISLIQKIILKE